MSSPADHGHVVLTLAKEIFFYALIAGIVQLGPVVPRPDHQPEHAGEGQGGHVINLDVGGRLIQHIVDVTSDLNDEHDRANCYKYYFIWF